MVVVVAAAFVVDAAVVIVVVVSFFFFFFSYSQTLRVMRSSAKTAEEPQNSERAITYRLI